MNAIIVLFKHRWKTLIIFPLVALFLAQAISTQLYQNSEGDRRTQLLMEIQKKLDSQTNEINTQTDRIIELQRQNGELQQLSVCLLQLIRGGDFTDKAECQKKADSFVQQNGIFEQPRPQANPAPTPSGSTGGGSVPITDPGVRCVPAVILSVCTGNGQQVP